MTSMDSMFSTATLLVSTPPMSPNEALFPSLTPSTSTAVPKAEFPTLEPPSRSENWFFAVRSGFMVFPPGRRAATSVMFESWRWFRASRPRLWLVLSPSFAFWAVTTTSSRARELSLRRMSSPSMSLVTSISMTTFTNPRQETSITCFPAWTFLNVNPPSASDTAQR